ncbi:transporter [Aeromicrobium sp. S22]|uniref:magnesium and cobalt transport protein CorA n=1 Tax=Aeromicrobium sp. S22 TaxID=2662029 RepID=UPI00129DB1B6|nr:magnesium and cobalt transport protein CorA [Aeromicrobium sp. S22]MRK00758.1 transporter [Aeromicrobium sp. S22]
MSLIDNAIYVGGRRTANPETLEATFELLRSQQGMAWIGLYRPDVAEICAVAAEFELHQSAVDDAIAAHQRPKLERYGSTLFAVLRPARYVQETEKVEFGELHVFVGPDFVVTIRHAESPDLGGVRQDLEADAELLRAGPESVLYAIIDQVVDEYAPVLRGLEDDIDEIEDQLFRGEATVSRRIYELAREVIEFQRATHSLLNMIASLEDGFDKYGVEHELQHRLRLVRAHCARIAERADSFRAILQNALTVHSTLISQRQNDEMRNLAETSLAQSEEVKKISGWAAILFAPTVVGTIYGMNFEHMPELAWRFGFPSALAAMALTSLVLYVVFKRRRWL